MFPAISLDLSWNLTEHFRFFFLSLTFFAHTSCITFCIFCRCSHQEQLSLRVPAEYIFRTFPCAIRLSSHKSFFFFWQFNYSLHKVQELKFVLLHPVPATVSPPSPQDLKFPVWSFFFFPPLWSDAPVNTQRWLSCATSPTVGPLGSRLVGWRMGIQGSLWRSSWIIHAPPLPPCLPPFLSAVHPPRPA